ncbi:MAG: hypothetical protein LAP40_05685 [Acidobacteriia bacterium]|nr:hypothetical protein [Terriglobia bacterium]
MQRGSMVRIAAVGVAAVLMTPVWAQFPAPPAGGVDLNSGRLAAGRGRGRRARPPAKPTPHWPNGRVNLGPAPGEKGVWEGNAGSTLATNARGIDNPLMNLPTNLKVSEVPFQPWARAVYDYRQSTTTKDDPHIRCKPSGGPRLFHTPYGFEFLDIPEAKRIDMVEVGGPHTWRTIYMDGRTHPKDLEPSFFGHSVGHWEGDALVVDTVGFNEKFWLTREGIPHTSFLHLTERFTRTDYDTLKYEATIDDPGAYTKPWTGGWLIQWQPDQELYEYVCQDNNRDPKHMYGGPRF